MLSGLQIRKHVVEFIRGTGMVTDGVVDATTTTGPWTWVMPACYDPVMWLCGGGGGGAGGGNPTGGGGGGGGSAIFLANVIMSTVMPGSTLTVTLGTGGAAGAVGAVGTQGIDTIVDVNSVRWKTANGAKTPVAQPGGTANGGAGGSSGAFGSVAAGGVAAAGASISASFQVPTPQLVISQSGAGGGAVNFTGGATFTMYGLASTYSNPANAVGNATNGGGGHGGQSVFGLGATGGFGGNGGAGGSAGSTPATGNYGAGGGGGGGGAAGGAGADGHVRITYYTLD